MMTLTQLNKRRLGFTLIEVVVVVTILVLLAGVLIPIVSNELSTARNTRAQTDLKAVAESFTRYFAHTGAWPADGDWNPNTTTKKELQGFACLYANVNNKKGWSGPYLNTGTKTEGGDWTIANAAATGSKGLVDPWGSLYKIHVYGRNGEMGPGGGMVLLSCGENGKVDSTRDQITSGEGAGDDVVQIVTRRL